MTCILLITIIVANNPTNNFENFCQRVGHSMETCYHRKKSAVSIFVVTVANIESIQPMATIYMKSKSSKSSITISTVNLQNIIANTIHMVGNASISSSLSVLSSMSRSYGFCLLQSHDTSL